jgi:hypothetical protein
MQAHPRHVRGLARGTQSRTDDTTIDVTASPRWREQQSFGTSVNEPLQMLADGGADIRRDDDPAGATAFRCVDPASLTVVTLPVRHARRTTIMSGSKSSPVVQWMSLRRNSVTSPERKPHHAEINT